MGAARKWMLSLHFPSRASRCVASRRGKHSEVCSVSFNEWGEGSDDNRVRRSRKLEEGLSELHDELESKRAKRRPSRSKRQEEETSPKKYVDRKTARKILEDNKETILKSFAEAQEKMEMDSGNDEEEVVYEKRRRKSRAIEECFKFGYDEEASEFEEVERYYRRKEEEAEFGKRRGSYQNEERRRRDEWCEEQESDGRENKQVDGHARMRSRHKNYEDYEYQERRKRRERSERHEAEKYKDRWQFEESGAEEKWRQRDASPSCADENRNGNRSVDVGLRFHQYSGPFAPEYKAWTKDDKRFQRRDDVSAGFCPKKWDGQEIESDKKADAQIRQLRKRQEEFYRQPSCIDTAHYGELLRRCGRTRNVEEGRRLHAKLAEGYFDRDTYLGNLLVQMYGSWGHVAAARGVFDKLDEKNVFSYNIMLAAYTRNGYLEEAREIFEQNKEKSVVSWNSMIAAYAQRGLLEESRRLFDRMPDKNVVSWTGMLQAYAKAGELDNAKSIFDRMEDRDLVTWNTMLAAFALTRGKLEEAKSLFKEMPVRDRVSWTTMMGAYNECGLGQEALVLYYRMLLEGLKPNNVTCIGVFYACAWIKSLKLASSLHRLLLAEGLHPDMAVNTALVSMYSKCGSLDNAHDVFDGMEQRDAITWTTMIAAFAGQGHVQQAQILFQAMPDKNVISWNTMMTSLVQVGKLEEARCMFDRMGDKNVFSWTTMIAGYAQAGHGVEALRLFALMDVDGVYPDRVTFTSVLDACANIPAPVQGRQLYEDVVAGGMDVKDDCVMATAMLKLQSSCGKLETAKMLFDDMGRQDQVAWSAMLAAYLHNDHEEEAVEMFREMLGHGLVPSGVTFITLFSACSHLGMLEEGRGYFFSMLEDYGIQPWLDHYLCMVDLLGRCGQLARAEELIEVMPYEPVAGAYRSLLAACRLHKDGARAERAARRASQLEPRFSTPYVILSNFHAQAGHDAASL